MEISLLTPLDILPNSLDLQAEFVRQLDLSPTSLIP